MAVRLRCGIAVAALCGALGCGGAGERGEPAPTAPDRACFAREVRAASGACRCPPDDALCPTGGFAHFTISNVAGSGLPNEVAYATGDGVIRDAVTGLLWQAAAEPARRGWEEAKAYCAALELGGRDDFRLPGRVELVTLLDFGEIPVIAGVFEAAVADYHWTSSPASLAPGSAYSVYFGAGETTIASARPGSAVVRCVAGDVPEPPSPQFEVVGDGVFDRVTGLVWELRFAEPAPFEAARERCAALGMRLPSIRELQSIVDENRHLPALDPAVFPDDTAERCWSGTLRGEDPWHVDFADGKTYADRFRDEPLASRCVR